MPVFFIIIVVSIIALNLRIRYLNKLRSISIENSFLIEDARANFSRAEKLDEEMFIRLTEKDFPVRDASYFVSGNQDNDGSFSEEIIKCQENALSGLKAPLIKTDIPTNTEIKQRFGVKNLQAVIDGEENHTHFIHNLNRWAELLIENGYEKDAETILEKAVLARSDTSKTYILLHSLYKASGRGSKISELSEKIELLPEIAKAIVKNETGAQP